MKIPVLLYHSISNDNSSMSLNINFFDNQMKYLKTNGYETINFNELGSELNIKKKNYYYIR